MAGITVIISLIVEYAILTDPPTFTNSIDRSLIRFRQVSSDVDVICATSLIDK
jgi:hypothetical protein